MADFPPVGIKEDSAKFEVAYEDPSVRGDMEGGIVITRKRHTRRPRRTFTSAFTDLSDAEKVLCENFYNGQGGGSLTFTYAIPTSGEVVTVRFKGDFKATYSGMGSNFRWDFQSFQLEEA